MKNESINVIILVFLICQQSVAATTFPDNMSPILLALVLTLLSAISYKFYRRERKLEGESRKIPPGPRRWPFIGSYHYVLWIDFYRPHIAFTKLKEIYQSPVISFGMGGFNAVVAHNYETCKEVLTNRDLQGRVPAYPGLVRNFGKKNGIFADDGPRWLYIKRHTLRALRDIGFGRRSSPFENVMEEEIQSLVDFFHKSNQKPVILPEAFFYTMFNLITHVTHGFRLPDEGRPVLTEMGKMALRLITETDATGRLIAIWPWIRHIFPEWSGDNELQITSAYFQEFVRNSLNKHQQNVEDKSYRDLIDLMLKDKEKFIGITDEEIITAIMDLMFPNAAVAIVVSFTLGLLAENPDKLKKCQNEIDQVVGRERLPNLNDRIHLKMVEGSIRESMRMYTLTPLSLPHRATEDTTLGGYHVEKDSLVITNLHAMNHDPAVFPNPSLFEPERFINGKDGTFSFGLGKRVCAGETFARQNLFVTVAAILQNFNLDVSTPLDSNRFRCGVALAPNPDFAMRFIPRS